MNGMISNHIANRDMAGQVRPLRLGFLGVGWIGLNRMRALTQSGVAEAVAIADPSPQMIKEAKTISPEARHVASLDDLLTESLDGLVIATPSANHALQSIQTLEAGMAVFCQKPLGRTAAEVRAVVSAARAADRLLGVDLSYRHTRAMQAVRTIAQSGELGKIFSVDVTFHNAYGPDKAWFYDKSLSGGGCVIDLGVHLIDLVLWILNFPGIIDVSSRLMREGEVLTSPSDAVEDYALATLELEGGTTVRLACSWRLQAGRDAVIEAQLFGTNGGCAFKNVEGSFYDFTAERYRGTQRETLVEPPDDWGGRAAIGWARRLHRNSGFDPECESSIGVAEAIERIYGI
ncbi:Gfo/Idh/MocA family protein [Rhizobium grahamii]|uniref:Oxidoreductase n=1 Tax=Rhizobium grahamii TaxID=1120045 RepID=A0A370KHR4_9HYPH|nr:Gfo/Idh/MocA family oxidoreductase [Rhizobium grahamii]RDJ03830.1 oxidoreductase [Rhizobium grahamii]